MSSTFYVLKNNACVWRSNATQSSQTRAKRSSVVGLMMAALVCSPLAINAQEGLHLEGVESEAVVPDYWESPFYDENPESTEPIVLDFEGIGNTTAVLEFYNGGTDGDGNPGPDYGISFADNALGIIDTDAGGSGNFANEPSQSTVLFFLSGSGVYMNVPAGFKTGFSFFYSSNGSASVSVYDGLNGTGSLLATLSLDANFDRNCTGDPTGAYCHWDPIGVDFNGKARSVNFGGAADRVGFDNITLGREVPGEPFPHAGVDHTTSLGMFGIRLTKAMGKKLLGIDTCPLGDPACLIESPLLFDEDTKIGRSERHKDGDSTDKNGAKVCESGNDPCDTFFPDPVKDDDFSWVPDTGVFTEGPPDTPEIHTRIISFNMTDNGSCGTISANAIRAGGGLPPSLGEVESLNQKPDDLPGESFFNIFVEVDLDWDLDGDVDMTVFNVSPLVIQNEQLDKLPPRVVYIHGGSDTPPAVFDKATNKRIGWITLAGHGVGYNCDPTDKEDFLDIYEEMEEQTVLEPIDHFKCYSVKGKKTNAKVDLEDLFGKDEGVKVLKPTMLCNPAIKWHDDKVFPVSNPEAHLVCYKVKNTSAGETVTVENQFGEEQELKVDKSKIMCVPSKIR